MTTGRINQIAFVSFAFFLPSSPRPAQTAQTERENEERKKIIKCCETGEWTPWDGRIPATQRQHSPKRHSQRPQWRVLYRVRGGRGSQTPWTDATNHADQAERPQKHKETRLWQRGHRGLWRAPDRYSPRLARCTSPKMRAMSHHTRKLPLADPRLIERAGTLRDQWSSDRKIRSKSTQIRFKKP